LEEVQFKNKIKIVSVPGKVFLAGEYLALHGGPALVFATQPRFELQIEESIEEEFKVQSFRLENQVGPSIFPEQSPGFKLFHQFSDLLTKYRFYFKDPYDGRGGWGASSAQFLSLYTFISELRGEGTSRSESWNWRELLQGYHEMAWNGRGIRPSGADIVGQHQGSITYFDPSAGKIESCSLHFSNIELRFVQTGLKIPTHEHLESLGDFSSEALAQILPSLWLAVKEGDEARFISGVQDYSEALQKLNFVCSSTQSLLTRIGEVPGVLASKGCGALGADVVLLVIESQKKTEIDEWLRKNNYFYVLSSQGITHGVRVSL